MTPAPYIIPGSILPNRHWPSARSVATSGNRQKWGDYPSGPVPGGAGQARNGEGFGWEALQ